MYRHGSLCTWGAARLFWNHGANKVDIAMKDSSRAVIVNKRRSGSSQPALAGRRWLSNGESARLSNELKSSYVA